VTADRDFSAIADQLSFDLYTPDELFTLIAHNDPHAVREVILIQVEYFNKKRQLAEEEGRPAPRSHGRNLPEGAVRHRG